MRAFEQSASPPISVEQLAHTIRRVALVSSVSLATIFLVVGGVAFYRIDNNAALPSIVFGALPLLLICGAGSYWARFLRWHLLILRLAPRLRTLTSARIYVAGFALGFTPGRIGELIKFSLLRQSTGLPEHESVGVFLIERLTEACAFAGIAIGGAWFSHVQGVKLDVDEKLAFVALPILAALPMAFGVWQRRGRDNKPPRWDGAIRSALRITGFRAVFLALLCAFLARGFDVVLFWIAVSMSGGMISLGESAFAWGTAGLIGGFSLLPAGIGAVEPALVATVAGFGVAVGSGLAAALLSRVATLWIWVIPGLVLAFRHLRPGLVEGDDRA